MSEIKVTLPADIREEKTPALRQGRFYLKDGESLVFVSSRTLDVDRVVTKMDDVKDGMITVAEISGENAGVSLYGLLGRIENYEEVDVEITVKRK